MALGLNGVLLLIFSYNFVYVRLTVSSTTDNDKISWIHGENILAHKRPIEDFVLFFFLTRSFYSYYFHAAHILFLFSYPMFVFKLYVSFSFIVAFHFSSGTPFLRLVFLFCFGKWTGSLTTMIVLIFFCVYKNITFFRWT